MDTRVAPLSQFRGRTASEVLEGISAAFPGDQVTVGELVDELDARANGVVLLVLALPMCIPNVPGISTIFGVLMLAPALQLVLGSHRLWLPKRARAWPVNLPALRKAFGAAIPVLKRMEFLIRPRFSQLTRFPWTIVVGLQTLLMAVILILPIPFGNWPPGMTVALTALALLQRDGLLMLATMLAAGASSLIAASVGYAVFTGIAEWLARSFGGG